MQVRQLQTPGELAVNRDTLRGTALGAAETVCPELLTKRSDSLGSCVLGERGGGKCQAGFLLLRHVPREKPGQTLRGDVGVSCLLGGLDMCMLVTYAELTCSHCAGVLLSTCCLPGAGRAGVMFQWGCCSCLLFTKMMLVSSY